MRLTELIKDGISIDQEQVIEQLQKQLLVSEAKLSQSNCSKDHLVREVQRYQVEFSANKSEMELLQLQFS